MAAEGEVWRMEERSAKEHQGDNGRMRETRTGYQI